MSFSVLGGFKVQFLCIFHIEGILIEVKIGSQPNFQFIPPTSQLWLAGFLNPLTPNDHYRGRTAPLTSKRSILYIYSTNIGTEYFKHGIYSPFFLFKMQFVS